MTGISKLSFNLLLVLLSTVQASASGLAQVAVNLNDTLYHLEIADDYRSRTRGLMFRSELATNHGMLFVYPRADDHRIWMKNTLLPLTVLWFDPQARIIDKQLLQPCAGPPCPVYSAPVDSRLILELAASEYDRFQVGDRLPELMIWLD